MSQPNEEGDVYCMKKGKKTQSKRLNKRDERSIFLYNISSVIAKRKWDQLVCCCCSCCCCCGGSYFKYIQLIMYTVNVKIKLITKCISISTHSFHSMEVIILEKWTSYNSAIKMQEKPLFKVPPKFSCLCGTRCEAPSFLTCTVYFQ